MKRVLLGVVVAVVVLFMYARVDKVPARSEISQKLRTWQSGQLLFEYEGHALSYRDSGGQSKEVIVLLHGYPTSSYDWHSIWSELGKDYRLIAMDMLGFGFSDKPDDITYSISLQADMQEALLRKLSIKRVNLLAHDYGDNIAQELLARLEGNSDTYSLEIRSLVLLNGALFPEAYNGTTIQSLLRSPLGGVISALGNARLFERNFAKVFGENTKPNKSELIDHWYLICQKNGNKISHLLTHASDDREANRDRWVGVLKTTVVPMLFINGLKDPVTGIETLQRYEELVPNPNVVRLDSIGHYPQLEAPDVVIDNVKSFVEENG